MVAPTAQLDRGPRPGRTADIYPQAGRGTQRLRVMHVIDRMDVGGTEKVMMQLIDRLDSECFEHCICTMRGATERARGWNPGLPFLDAGAGASHFQLNVFRLARRMKTIQPAIVHSRNWGGIEAIAAARLAGVPVSIHSEHGYQLEMRPGLPRRQRLFRKLSYRFATAVFTVTDELREYHEREAGCAPGTVRVIYNGVDSQRFSPQPEVGRSIRHHFNIPADSLVLGFVGRMVALKDVTTLLKAVELIASDTPKVHVLLVGTGPEMPNLQEYVHRSRCLTNRVTFAGMSDQTSDFFNAMDVFVLPSLMEGMSNTLLEALASGLPVVATRVGGNPEVVEDTVCGCLFRPHDAEDLADQLLPLLHSQQLRAQMGRFARQRAVNKFSLEHMLSQYSNLYLSLASKKGVTLPRAAHVRN